MILDKFEIISLTNRNNSVISLSFSVFSSIRFWILLFGISIGCRLVLGLCFLLGSRSFSFNLFLWWGRSCWLLFFLFSFFRSLSNWLSGIIFWRLGSYGSLFFHFLLCLLFFVFRFGLCGWCLFLLFSRGFRLWLFFSW